MAQALIHLRHVATCALLAGAPGAMALGPSAPFEPPRAASSAASAASGADAGSTDGLAGMRIGPRRSALIDGRWVEPGASVRGAVLVSIGDNAVQLRHPDGRIEVLRITPDVDMRVSRRASSTAKKEAPKP